MTFWDAIGFGASALVLLAFYQRRMVPLRVAALGSNMAFIIYGLALGLAPVWLLHAVLLPVNASRLAEALRSRHSLDEDRH
jgi:CRP/FNR family transcriptional regulator, cyclic AMP receptor protein